MKRLRAYAGTRKKENTALRKIGSPQYDIHYWLGHDATEVLLLHLLDNCFNVDSVLASDKALELDAALGCCTVQYREVQGQETEKFLSYFKPCIIPVEGKYSPQNGLAEETYPVTLLMCKGDHAVRVKEVPFLRSSLNHDDVFVLDTASKVFLFAGCNSSTQEKAKALEVVEYIKDNKHAGRCQVATIEDGKFLGDADAGEFWTFLVVMHPFQSVHLLQTKNRLQPHDVFKRDHHMNKQDRYSGNLHPTETSSLNKDMLEKDKCYMLDCDSEEFLRKEGRSTSTSLVLLTEGLENARFRSFFDEWPQTAESSLYNEVEKKWQEDRADAISNASAIVSSTKGESVMCHIHQGQRTFSLLFNVPVASVFKGGLSKRYKTTFLVENANECESKASLFRVQGQAQGACKQFKLLPSRQPMTTREGSEPDTFWDLLGGKTEYPKEKETRKQVMLHGSAIRTCIFMPNMILLLDCQTEVYVWIGLNSNIKSKQQALTLGLKFLEMDILEEGLLTVRSPVYVVTEGHEPPFFTRFFDWVPEKANMHGNSFERKLASLKGKESVTNWKPVEIRLKGERITWFAKSVKWIRARSIILLQRKFPSYSQGRESNSDSTPLVKKLFSESLSVDTNNGSTSSNSDISKENSLGGIKVDLSLESLAYSYEQLRVDSPKPVTDIDATRREAYLTEKEFEERFEMTKPKFYALPKWKQNNLKMSLRLF
ncbi:hypothetical protein HID58_063721 [Brassica napus]|uniref:HP domain-containing protein n=1 Tax=Brassica napus TaxID=3708 RepID=A0ABQ7XF14_BRANA|nr:hypothetical protein HID58_063721 [Brassica napus]